MKLFLLTFLIFSFGCGQIDGKYVNYFQNVSSYHIRVDLTTPLGFQVDSGGFKINLNRIDDTVTKIETCLQNLIDRNYELPSQARCLTAEIRPLPIRRDCIRIKFVAPIQSACSEWHFLKEEAHQELCDKKGIEKVANCPCRWRWAVQDDNDLVMPYPHDDFYYLYDIVKIHTGCNNIWLDTELSRCANLVSE